MTLFLYSTINYYMPILENTELLKQIAESLGTKAIVNGRGTIFFTGKDSRNNLVAITVEPANKVLDICEVVVTEPGNNPKIAGFANGTIQQTPEGNLIMSDQSETSFIFSPTLRIAAFRSTSK